MFFLYSFQFGLLQKTYTYYYIHISFVQDPKIRYVIGYISVTFICKPLGVEQSVQSFLSLINCRHKASHIDWNVEQLNWKQVSDICQFIFINKLPNSISSQRRFSWDKTQTFCLSIMLILNSWILDLDRSSRPLLRSTLKRNNFPKGGEIPFHDDELI